jgi:hypothetical protein
VPQAYCDIGGEAVAEAVMGRIHHREMAPNASFVVA